MSNHENHITPLSTYLIVFAGLILCTVLTLLTARPDIFYLDTSFFDLGSFNIVLAMLIASFKASLVLMFFMGLRWDKGFNLLAEYVNTAAYELDGSSINAAGTDLLEPTEISTYLILGNAYNIQVGYLLKGDWSIDAKWGQSFKEFDNDNSLLVNYDSMGGGLTKYFSERAVKAQLMATYYNFVNFPEQNQLGIECVFQVKF